MTWRAATGPSQAEGPDPGLGEEPEDTGGPSPEGAVDAPAADDQRRRPGDGQDSRVVVAADRVLRGS